jgi:hypothetical protein
MGSINPALTALTTSEVSSDLNCKVQARAKCEAPNPNFSRRVSGVDRIITHIGIQVQLVQVAHRVGGQEPADDGVVVPRLHVGQPGGVLDVAGVALLIAIARAVGAIRFAKGRGVVGLRGRNAAVLRGYRQRRAQVIVHGVAGDIVPYPHEGLARQRQKLSRTPCRDYSRQELRTRDPESTHKICGGATKLDVPLFSWHPVNSHNSADHVDTGTAD